MNDSNKRVDRPWLAWLLAVVGVAAVSVPMINRFSPEPGENKPLEPTTSSAAVPSESPDQVRQAIAAAVKHRLLRAGWPLETATQVVDLNLDWFVIQAEENEGGFELQLKLLEALGDHPLVFSVVEDHPELAGLVAGSASPEDVAKSLSVPARDYEPLTGLFLQHAASHDRTTLTKALLDQRDTIRFLQDRGLPGAEVLFMYERPAAGPRDWSFEYDRWLHDELESRRHVPDEEIASFVNLALTQGPAIRRRLAEDESFRRGFRTQLWPKLNRAASGTQQMFEVFLRDSRIWDLLQLDPGESLLEGTGPLAIDLLYGYPEEGKPAYPAEVHGEVIQILLRGEPLSIQALLEFRREPLFIDLLKKQLPDDTRTAALAKLFQARPNHTPLLATYVPLTSAALADEVGPPPHGVITWVPFYYTVYEVPKKLLQGRDATAMDLIQAALDPVMLIADVATGGGAEVTRRALIAAGKETGERLGEKAIVVTLEKSAADLASRKIGAEAAEQVATRGGVAMADLTMTALLSETQAAIKGAGRVSTIDVTNLVRFLHRSAGLNRQTMREWLGLEARLFMRGDAKVFFQLHNVPKALMGAKAAEFLARTGRDLMIGGAVESERGQDVLRDSARRGIEAKDQAVDALRSWRQHVSAIWLLQASQAPATVTSQ
jgi:hypothetical protein